MFLSNNKIVVFSKKEEKSNHSINIKGVSVTRRRNIFSIRSDYILAGNILSTPTYKLFWKITFR